MEELSLLLLGNLYCRKQTQEGDCKNVVRKSGKSRSKEISPRKSDSAVDQAWEDRSIYE